MAVTVSWTKSWSAADDGSILGGADLGNLQTNIAAAFADSYSLSSSNAFTGSGQPNRTIILTPGGALLPSASAATRSSTNGTNFTYQTLDFSNAADSSAYWVFKMPGSLTGATAQVTIYWTATAGTATHGVEFEVSAVGVMDDEVLDSAVGSAVEIEDALLATADLHISAAGSLTHGWAADDLAVVKLLRDVDGHSGSQLAADCKVLCIVLEWKAGSSTD